MRLQSLLVVAQVAARRADHRLRHPQPLRHLDGEAAAGRAVQQLVGRREVLRIERKRRDRDAIGADAPGLHRVEVRGRDEQRALLPEMLDDGRGEGAALVRIRAGADFVEQHQRRQFQLAIHPHDVGDVRGKRAQARFDRLFVANIGKHAAKDRQLRHRCRHVQAGLRHQGEQPRRLERDGLAAGVGTGDEQHAIRRVDHHVDGHCAVKHRVASRLQLQRRINRERRLDAVDLRAVARLRLKDVQFAAPRCG